MRKSLVIAAAATGFSVHSLLPALFNKYANPSVIKECPGKNTIMLTFDDGPDPRYTARLLDLLKEYHIHATFFVVLLEARKHEKLIDRMIREGHQVGFHSVSHQNAMFQSYFYTKYEFEEGSKFFRKKQVSHVLYRPPWGLCNCFTEHFAKAYGMKIVLWSAMAGDWEEKASPRSIVEKCREHVKEHSILCLHDGGEKTGGAPGAPLNTIHALEILIPEWLKKNYRFVLLKTDGGMERWLD